MTAYLLRTHVRALFRERVFAATAVVTIAIAISGVMLASCVLDAVVLRSLPYADGNQLVVVQEAVAKLAQSFPSLPANATHFLRWRAENSSFESLAALRFMEINLSGGAEPEHLIGARVSPALFPLLRVNPQLGRTFALEEETAGNDQVAIITNGIWRRSFALDPLIIGRTIELNGHPFVIVGVLPASFQFPRQTDLDPSTRALAFPEVFIPLALRSSELRPTGNFDYSVIGRLRPHVTLDQAATDLNAIQASEFPHVTSSLRLNVSVLRLKDQIVGRFQRRIYLIQFSTMMLLLIVLVNIAALFTSRTARRWREIAVQSALGAGRFHIFAGLMTEAVVITVAGSMVGTSLAALTLPVLRAVAPSELPYISQISFGWRVVVLSLALEIVSVLIVCTLPLLAIARADLFSWLRDSASVSSAHFGRFFSLGKALVAAQLAVSVMVFGSAFLLVSSFFSLIRVDRGFSADGVVAVEFAIPSSFQTNTDRQELLQRLIQRISLLPGVDHCGVISTLPLGGEANVTSIALTNMEGRENELSGVQLRYSSPDVFRALAIPIRSGRYFGEGDQSKQEILLSESVAGRLVPHGDILSRSVTLGTGENYVVAGVVGDIRASGLDQAPTPMIYVPYSTLAPSTSALVFRVRADPSSVVGSVRHAVRDVNPGIPIIFVQPIENILRNTISSARFQAAILTVLAAITVIIIAMGTYALNSFSVVSRRKEIATRIALGATWSNVAAAIVGQGLPAVVYGVVTGLLGFILVGQLWKSLVFSGTRIGVGTMMAVATTELVVALLSMFPPIVVAVRTDPSLAIRA